MFGLFRLPPIAYWLLCPLGIAAAVALYISDQNKEAEKARALAATPPAAVKLEAFDARRDTGVAQEVTIVAQADVTQAMDVTRSKRGNVREQWVIIPLYPTTAKDSTGAATGVFLQHGTASVEQLEKLVVSEGAFGPILQLNGTMIDPATESEALETIRGRMQIAPNAVYIDPFEAGRGAGLAASDNGRQAAFGLGILSLLVGLYGVGRYFFAGRGSEGYI